MNKKAVDLFLLISSLSQLKDTSKVISLFIASLPQIFPGFACTWSKPGDAVGGVNFEACSVKHSYGHVNFSGEARLDPMEGALVQNACQLIAALLERLDQEKLLTDQNHYLESLVQERTRHLLASREELRSITENLPDVILRFDREGRHLFANGSIHEATGLLPEQLIGKTHRDLGFDEQLCQVWEDGIQEVFRSGTPAKADFSHTREGATRFYTMNLIPEFGPARQVATVLGIAHDITPRRRWEIELQEKNQALAVTVVEKETLIRELYHRTKNTLQLISGMLVLQAATHGANEDLQYLVRMTDQRIQAIALVHRMLYQAQDLSRIDMHDYVTELIGLIFHSHGVEPGRIGVEIQVEALGLLLDTAIPFGLILNELLGNALKHGFTDGRSGCITITMRRASAEGIHFCFADDGAGVPAGFDFRNNATLGLKLIHQIGEQQMQGRVLFEGGEGVRCSIDFPTELYRERV